LCMPVYPWRDVTEVLGPVAMGTGSDDDEDA